MNSIIITDGEQRSALAVVRSLGRAGYRTIVCSASRKPLAAASRFAADSHQTPDPRTSPEEFVRQIVRIAASRHAAMVLPVTDASTLAILRYRDMLGGLVLPFPSDGTFEEISDKRRVLDVARSLGIATPRQVVVETKDQVRNLSHVHVPFPVAIKPSRSENRSAAGRSVRSAVAYAIDAQELAAQLDAIDDTAYPVLLQERITGKGVGVFLLAWKGRLLAAFSHERLREKPPQGGVSVRCMGRVLPDELLTSSRALLDHFGWEGAAMVEFKERESDGLMFLMEVNPRFWGSLQLAIDSGVDFPRILVDAIVAGKSGPVPRYVAGAITRWYWGEIDHLIALVKSDSSIRASGARVMSPLRTFFDVILPLWPGVHNETLRLSDPRPFFRESLDWFKALIKG